MPVKMMYQSKNLSYLKGGDFQALSIPYKGDRQFMYIFLPNKGVDLSLFQSQFTAQNWQTWKSAFSDNLVDLSLPKFTINFSEDLSDSLKTMGMAEAFDRKKADFSNMIIAPNRAWISRVLQKTYMGVNEEGTEAAAVTAVIMGATCAYIPPKPAIEFKVDRPFVLVLADKETDKILFLGSIVEPK
jgi:serpin B